MNANHGTDRPVILLVDDTEAARYGVARVLGKAGFEVWEAADGREAMAKAELGPALVLLDLNLPDIHGFEVMRRLKDNPKTARIPIVHLTSSYSEPEHWTASLEGGSDGYVVQPVDPEVLVAIVRSVLRARAAETEVRRESLLWQATFDAIGDAVAVLDRDFRITRCNRSMATLFGDPPEDLRGCLALPQVPNAEPPPDGWPVERAQRSGQRETATVTAGDRAYLVIADPLREAQGFVSTVVDVTDQRRQESHVQALLDESERVGRVKDEFLATLSHELRNPLNSILGWTHVLRQGQTSAREKSALEAIDRGARTQAVLIEDILDVSRIITGKLRLNLRAVDVRAALHSAMASIQPSIAGKRLTVDVAEGSGPAEIYADPQRLQQILWNLLSNAAKFTPAGGRIAIQIGPEDDGILVSITDTGAGIEPAFLPYVFDRFRQADGTPSRRQGGLGLGLAIVRHLTELHGGRVSARSEGSGLGATFLVYLPRGSQSPAVAPSESDAPVVAVSPLHDTERLDGIHVLLVEDEADNLEMLAALLRSLGAEVDTADSAEGAIASFCDRRPAVVVSDLGLPGHDGYGLMETLMGVAPGAPPKAIALSGYAREQDRARALAVGFRAHLSKPVDPAALAGLIRRLAEEPTPSEEP